MQMQNEFVLQTLSLQEQIDLQNKIAMQERSNIILLFLLFISFLVIIAFLGTFLIKRYAANNYGVGERNDMSSKLQMICSYFRHFWWSFLIYIVATSIIFLFTASFIFKEEITLDIMNQWVGLILGMVALLIGIISLIISFYNVDQAFQTQSETNKYMNEMRIDIKKTLEAAQKIEKGMEYDRTSNFDSKTTNQNHVWKGVKEEENE